jgi:hypothetical protein
MQTALRTATYAMHVTACALPDLIAGPSQGAAAAGLLPHDPYGSQSTALVGIRCPTLTIAPLQSLDINGTPHRIAGQGMCFCRDWP